MDAQLKELLEQNKNINRGFRDLVVWKEAIELFTFVREKFKTLIDPPFQVNAQM